jgi:hypothetical protein
MTDRYHTLTVVLDKDIRDDDADGLKKAIAHMRGVLSVTGKVADMDSHMAYERARADLGEQIWKILYPKYKVD